MAFDTEKQVYLARLGRPDRSKKGDVDEAMWPLLNAINALPDYYTTSSCAGRISLFVEPASGKKYDSEWHFVTHDPTSYEAMRPALSMLPDATVWFRMEAAILHVVARDEDAANRFLHAAREAGFKHSGLLSTTKRYVIECVDSERIDVPIAVEGKLIVEKGFLTFLIEKANDKLRGTRQAMEKLQSVVAALGKYGNASA